ncbi:MAG: alpha-amylase family glycosyl hydrolase [Bacteroidota bacterium]
MAAPLPWWKTSVIYQIYPRSFYDANGDGLGDLPGLTAKLGYVADLGVDAVWLSPFYRSPMVDFGYDVADYTDVDPRFGTLADFDALVEAAQAQGLKLVVDFVPNHSSDRHPWFAESRRSQTNPKRDWYVWKDPAPDGGPPTNWLSIFGGPAWTFDEARGQYYLHSFLPEQPDLNWRHPAVVEAMFDVLRFWMDRGVDGFRIDVAHFIMKDPAFRDNPPNPTRRTLHKDMGDYDTLLPVHSGGHPDVHPMYRRIRRLVDEHDPDVERVTIGEIHVFDLDAWTAYYGADLDEFHLPFNFTLLRAPWTAAGIREQVDALETALPEGAWPTYVLGNHDEQRIATRLGGEAQARQAALLLLTLRGTPTLYYGDELGMREVAIPPAQQQDPWGRRVPGLGRDGCRTPMPWSNANAALGFSDADPSALWLPAGDGRPGVNVATQQDTPTSIFHLYKALLALRRTHPALHQGSYTPLHAPANVYAYDRAHGAETFRILLNFSEAFVDVPLEMPLDVVLSTQMDRLAGSVRGFVRLRAHEGLLLRHLA